VAGERKVVTVLFADLTGYTALASTLDPEEVYSFIRPAMTRLVELVEGFGGTVPQVMGDGFLAIFGVPAIHEDDAERAVRAALEAVDSIRTLNSGRTGIRLPDVHAGLNTGEVMVAPAAQEPSGFNVTGDAVNMGARVAGLAEGGQVLVTEHTRELTSHAIRYGRRLARRVKGKKDPIPVYQALAPATPVPAGHISPSRATPFVGREEPLQRLNQQLAEAVASGRSRVFVVVGDSGVGKSRLAAEFAASLAGFTVLTGTCPPYGQRLPLIALAEAVGGLGDLSKLGGGVGAPAFTRHLKVLTGQGSDAPGTSPSDTGKDARLAAVAVLQAIARMGPAVLILDDLQWADDDLLEVLRQAHANAWPGRLFVLGLARPEIEGALPGITFVRLEPMNRKDTGALVDVVLGAGVPQRVLESLVARSGGNPLFLEEGARMLTESGILIRDAGWKLADPAGLDSVPATLRLLIAARLDGLAPDEKRVLQDASVAGQATWDRLAEQQWGGPEARRILRRLEGRDLLRRRPRSTVAGATEFEFKHALIRDVAYDSLPRSERAARHLHIAEWLRASAEGSDEPVDALANHYEQAWDLASSRTGGGPDPETARLAAEYLMRWGDRAFAFQPRLAESVYARGLAVARSSPGVAGPEILAGLLIGRAESLIELAKPDEARAEAREALDLAALVGRPDLRARALLALGRAESDLPNVEVARRLLEEALALLESAGDVRGQAWALHRLSETWRFDDLPREVELLRRAHDLLTGLGDRWGRALMAQEIAYLLTTDGGPEFDQSYEEARALAEEEGDLRSRAALLRTASYHAYFRWDFERAIEEAARAGPAAREAGDTWVELDALVIQTLSSSAVRSPAEAAGLANELLRRAREVSSLRLEALADLASARAGLRLGEPRLALGKIRAARRALGARGASGEMGDADMVEALVHLERGTWKRVSVVAARIETRGRQGRWRLFLPLEPLLVGRARLGAGRVEDAVPMLEQAALLARQVDAPGTLALARVALDQARILSGRRVAVRGAPRPASLEVRAIVQENRAFLALRDGDPVEAAERFGAAVSCWEELGLTVWLARALGSRAGALREAKRPAQARRALARGDAVLAAIEAPRDALP